MKYIFYDKSGMAYLTYSVVPPKDLLDDNDYVAVDFLDDPAIKEGKKAILKINIETKQPFYEYIDVIKPKENIEKETFTQTLAELTIENKKKDAMISNLAETVAKLTIEVNQLKGSVE